MTEPNVSATEKALRLREKMRRRKPNFVRPESWRYVRLKKSWRRPQGLDHKVRLMYKGWPPSVSVGYRMPRAARGIHPSGFKEVLVHNVDELVPIDAEIQVVRIAHTVGKRKRGTILAEARKKGITVLNIKQVREEVKKTETKKEQPEKPETAEKTIGEEEKESKEPLESTEKKPQGRRRRPKKTEEEQEQ